ERLTATIAGMAVGIVSVFMVVGGVVIMNIMLAVVTERTHEIGIRKSLGARRRDILYQYLVESSVLSAVGGLAGVVLAWMVAFAVRNLTSVPMALPWTSVIIGVGLSATVGLFFGIYPARRASMLDPIEALRVERERMSGQAISNGPRVAFPAPPQPQAAGLPDGAGRDHRDRHHHRRGGHSRGVRCLHYGDTEELRAELDHRLQISRGPANQQPDGRGAHPQRPHLPERRGHPRALQIDRRRFFDAVRPGHEQRPL